MQSIIFENNMKLAFKRTTFSIFNSNYSRIMLQSSGHLATERPLYYNYILPDEIKLN